MADKAKSIVWAEVVAGAVRLVYPDGVTVDYPFAVPTDPVVGHHTRRGVFESLKDSWAPDKTGDWATRRAYAEKRHQGMLSGELRGTRVGSYTDDMLVAAIMGADPKLVPSKIRATIKDWTAAQRQKFVKSQPKVALEMAKIIAARNGGDNAPDLADMFE